MSKRARSTFAWSSPRPDSCVAWLRVASIVGSRSCSHEHVLLAIVRRSASRLHLQQQRITKQGHDWKRMARACQEAARGLDLP